MTTAADRDDLGREEKVPFSFVGIHHVRIPVSDAWVSRDWYQRVLGFSPMLDVEDASGLVGVVLRHPAGPVIGLHQDPVRAATMSGFCVVGLDVTDVEHLLSWSAHLADQGVEHSGLTEGHLGWYVEAPDPDGIVVRLYTGHGPNAEEA